MFTNLTIANDNRANNNGPTQLGDPHMANSPAQDLPSDVYAGGMITVSDFSPVKPKIHITRSQVSHSGSLTKKANVSSGESIRGEISREKLEKNGRGPVYFLFFLWLLVLLAIVYTVLSSSDNSFSTLTSTAAGLGILSLILTSSAQKHRAKIIHSLGISMASLCFAVLLWIYFQTTGRSISPEILVMSLSGASLVMARVWQSPYLLNVSLLLGLGWSIYAFMAYHPSELVWIVPALWSVQMFFALEFRITRTVMLSIVSGLVWIGVNLPYLNL